MKHVKSLGLLAVAAASMMSFAASASADYLSTTTGGATAEPTFHAVNEGHVTLENSFAYISCSSTIQGTTNTHGIGEDVSGPLSHLTFTGCTNSWHVTTETPGSLTVRHTSGHNGDLFSTGASVHATRFGVDCYYETVGTTIGTLTGGDPATLHIFGAIPLNELRSDALCGQVGDIWEGNYVTTSALYVNNS